MTANPIERLDTALAVVEVEALLLAGRVAEQRHQLDPFDSAFSALACAHPEACACPADYPDWRPGGAA
ncbi:hypothetical protein [Streptomyces luteocolor]|uniref:hypothetical protein n=1 Tax=Streptomyces luteocolor TaxID=285500 RepID=UPI000852E616|nr:hypothetical protein [Streptomyces luteocolor]